MLGLTRPWPASSEAPKTAAAAGPDAVSLFAKGLPANPARDVNCPPPNSSTRPRTAEPNEGFEPSCRV